MMRLKLHPRDRFTRGRLTGSLIQGAVLTAIYMVVQYTLTRRPLISNEKVGYIWGMILVFGVLIVALCLPSNAGIDRK